MVDEQDGQLTERKKMKELYEIRENLKSLSLRVDEAIKKEK